MAKLSVELQRYFFEEDIPDVKLEDIPDVTLEDIPDVTLEDILKLAGERIFGFLFVILSLPSALPIPAPGYSIPFAIVIFVLAVQLIAGAKRPWLPQRMMNAKMKLTMVQGFLNKGIPWLRRIEALTRPRLAFICTSLPGRIFIGSTIALMSISMMIPIPGTNTLPAIGIFVTGLGLVEDDGAISLAGLVLCVLGAAVSISIVLALYFGGTTLVEQIKTWLGR